MLVKMQATNDSRLIMGEFANGLKMKIFATATSCVIIGINVFFVVEYVSEELPQEWYTFVGVAIFGFIYITFIAYLSVYLLICLGWESLALKPWVRRYYWVEDFVQDHELRQKANKA
jgi:Mn2+/Fe2+ NRAMP family transporter